MGRPTPELEIKALSEWAIEKVFHSREVEAATPNRLHNAPGRLGAETRIGKRIDNPLISGETPLRTLISVPALLRYAVTSDVGP